MVQPSPPGQGRVYGFRCLRCGNGLELPPDLRVMAIDCPYCGQDNLLPPEIVQARQRQYELDQQHYALQIQEQDRQRIAQERDKVRKQSSQRLLIWLGVGGFFAVAMIGGLIALGYYAQQEEADAKARAQDPKVNGHALMLAHLAQMQKRGCSRILIQPSTHVKETSTISLDMIKNDACVHILGFTAAGATLSMKYQDSVALTVPLPPPSPVVDYRLCASETATHTFKIDAAPEEPFTTAAIECPRTPAEGGARSSKNDPKKTGQERVQGMLDELVKAGCKNVVSEPQVVQREESMTITSPENA
ncbi:MAG TPA: hypothetical protein VNG33_01530, partial [Polyangiaceae bacterium]|nr:hypothetical protein [Polyangiaceae bacterium]